jgi:hypothetical protein
MKILKYLKCRITGYYKKITTGKCGLHLYYDGCGCDECQEYEKKELELVTTTFINESN